MERRRDGPHSVLRLVPDRRSHFVVEHVVVDLVFVSRQAVEEDPVVAVKLERNDKSKRVCGA